MIFKQAQIDKYLKKNDPAIKAFVVYGSNEGLVAEYVKKLRILSAISGAILTATSALEYFGVLVPGTTLGWISWAIGLASIIPMMVYSSKSTDREAAKAGRPTAEAAKAKGQPMPAKDPLRAAFVFDDEEEEADNLTGNGKE